MDATSTFVHVIESPGSVDLLDGRTEGRSLCAFLDIAEIPNTYCLATDPQTFDLAMTDRLKNAIMHHSAFPILHISAHGTPHEIALTNNDRIKWTQLGDLLQPINQEVENGLLVCLSSCYGSSANKMILDAKSLPTSTLVGCEGAVAWHQAVIAYITFYNHLLKIGSTLETAVVAMNTACGRQDFKAVNVRSNYNFLQYFRKLTLPQMNALIERMEQLADDDPMAPSRKSAGS